MHILVRVKSLKMLTKVRIQQFEIMMCVGKSISFCLFCLFLFCIKMFSVFSSSFDISIFCVLTKRYKKYMHNMNKVPSATAFDSTSGKSLYSLPCPLYGNEGFVLCINWNACWKQKT